MAETTRGPARMTIASLITSIAAVGVFLAVLRQIEQAYDVPQPFTFRYPRHFAMGAVAGWIVLGALAAFALRGGSLAGLAARVLVTSLLCLTRLAFPSAGDGIEYHMLWPVYCFGLGVVGPLLILRFRPARLPWARADGALAVLIDSACVALLVLLFADFVLRA
jgi:hypothetical protein